MTHGITNIMRREAQRAMARLAATRIGIVSSYDPDNYAVKVRIQPEDVETGWLPLGSNWTGNGWGDFSAPSIGDVVEVHHQEGSKQAGIVGQRFFGDEFRPLPVPSGERWIVHKSGSCFKFHNDGTVEMSAATAINVTAPNFNLNGNMNVTGDLLVTGDIKDIDGESGSLSQLRSDYNEHRHPGVTAGSDSTGPTDHIA